VLQHYLAVHSFMQRHQLSREAKEDLLRLIELHCPAENHCLTTLHTFEHYIASGGLEFSEVHYFCPNCQRPFAANEEVCPHDQTARSAEAHFVVFKLEAELRARCADPRFWQAIRHPLDRVQPAAGVIEDVYDGTLYPQHTEHGQLHCLGSADGIRVFKSARKELWLVMVVLLELPPSIRYKQENLLLLAAWHGPGKPEFRTFLSPVMAQLQKLRNGLIVHTPDGDRQVTLRLLAVTADNPAKEALLRLSSNACGVCLQAPELVANVNGVNTVATFPYIANPPLRTRASIIADALAAAETQRVTNGLAGPSVLSLIPELDLVFGIDYQHNVCLRVMSKGITLWLDPAHAGRPWSIRNRVAEFDNLMVNTRPPAFITRPPRPYTGHIQHWKAVEYRNFLLYYGPIVLRGLLGDPYYRHFLLLSNAVGVLLERRITPDNLTRARDMLHAYVRRFAELYGQRYVSKTVHSLIHLADCVRKLGPLWVPSCFPFESAYHYLVQQVHGTRFPLEQVRASLSLTSRLSLLCLSSPLIQPATPSHTHSSATQRTSSGSRASSPGST